MRRAAIVLLAVLSIGNLNAAEVYVAPWGKDANDGSELKPFASVHAARDAVRSKIKEGLKEDMTILMREGIYYLSEPLQLGPEDSGTDKHSVSWEPFRGERVRLVGGEKVPGWKKHSDKVWKAVLPEEKSISQLFEDNKRLVLARWPDKEYLSTPKASDYLVTGGPTDGFGRMMTYFPKNYPKTLDPGKWDINGASVFIWPGMNWFSQNNPIENINTNEHVITMARGGGVRQWNRYYIQNVLELLDRPGECRLDPRDKSAYVWPRKGPMHDRTITASTMKHVLVVEGTKSNIVRNVHFKGIDFSISNGDVVRLSNVEEMSIQDSIIENGGGCGVAVYDHAKHINIQGNLIQYNGWHGVSFRGLGPGHDDVHRQNIVANNHIRYCGRKVGHSYGVRVRFSGHNRIVNNHIHNMPRFGISLKGMDYVRLSELADIVDIEERFKHLYSSNNEISHNYIHDVNTESQDAGAIEAWHTGRDNEIHHNLIHSVGNSMFTLQAGISLDDGSEYFTVHDNIVYDVIGLSTYGIHVRGSRNTIINNIFILSEGTHAAIRSGGVRIRSRENTFKKNIFYFEGEDATTHMFFAWEMEMVAASDSNVFWSKSGKKTFVIKGIDGVDTIADWVQIGEGHEKRSMTMDPLFVNAADRDYTVKGTSPALKLGFRNIDVEGIGLRKDFASRLR